MDLRDLYTPRGLLDDVNGDGWNDAVRALLVLRHDATLDEQVAAVNIAGRLGFETMSLALPIAAVEDATQSWPGGLHPIFVGLDCRAIRALVHTGVLALEPLGAGEGLICRVPGAGHMPDGILVAGGDGDGLAVAAALLFGRLPYIWHVGEGRPTVAETATHIREALEYQGVRVASLAVVSLRVGATKPGVERLDVDLECPDAATFERAAAMIEDPATPLATGNGLAVRGLAATVRCGASVRRVIRAVTAHDAPGWPPDTAAGGAGIRYSLEGPLGLSTLYAVRGGLFVDTYGDLQPNRLHARMVLARSCTVDEAIAACDLAARLGLEALGMDLPLATREDRWRSTDRGEVSILIGGPGLSIDHRSTAGMPALDLVTEDGEIGAGVVSLGEGADNRPILSVAGADPRGTGAALRYLAAHAPFLSRPERGQPELADLEGEIQDALAGIGAAGEAAAVLASLEGLPGELADAPLTSLQMMVVVSRPAPGLDACVAARLRSLVPGVAVSVDVQDRAAPIPLIDDVWEAPWEIERARALLAETILPAPGERAVADASLDIDLRVSEPLAVRQALHREIHGMVTGAGAAPERCHLAVRSTYKQGFGWLLEDVSPRLRAQGGVARLTVRCKRFVPPSGAGWVDLPLRWIQELFPADELLARDLGIESADIRFELRDDLDVTYELIAEDAAGRIALRDTFTARTDERPYLSGYPHWGLVHPDTGWLTVRRDGVVLLDRRLPTDREAFWDYYQGTILPRIGDRIRSLLAEQSPDEASPFFERLEIALAISEEDRPLGLREERLSPLESLHEDLYFVTLDYCSAVMLTAQAQAVGEAPYEPPWMRRNDDSQFLPRSSPHSAPGLIVPIVHQRLEAGVRAHVRMDALPAGRPTIRWRATVADGTGREGTHAIPPISCPRPRTEAVAVDPAGTQVKRAALAVVLDDEARFDVLVARLDALALLHTHGLYSDVPLRIGIDRLAVRIGAERTVVLGPGPLRDVPEEDAADPAPAAPDDITWDTLIGYEENHALLRRLGTYPEVRVWQAGTSLQGRRSYAVEVTAPLPGPLRSQAKESTFKPTLLINTRHHANETSGTGALLRLVALCATDPTVRGYLGRANLVVVPFENVDGAVLHEELQREHPTWMLHAGRYNARGIEFRLDYMNGRTPYPEARVLPRVFRLWLPDIVTDDHGFPSHEWAQPFGGYANPWFASDWIPRGLIYLYLPYAHGPRYTGQTRLALALRDVAVAELNGDAEVRAWNRTWADRFVKYVHQWMPERFPADYCDDVLVHAVPIIPDATRVWSTWVTGFADVYPQITAVSWITEVADETAQGAYHHLCARAHLLVDLATLRLLATSAPAIVRSAEEAAATVFLSIHRARPPAPAEVAEAAIGASGARRT